MVIPTTHHSGPQWIVWRKKNIHLASFWSSKKTLLYCSGGIVVGKQRPKISFSKVLIPQRPADTPYTPAMIAQPKYMLGPDNFKFW